MKTHSKRRHQYSCKSPAAASSSLDRTMMQLIKNHDTLMETVSKTMKTARDALDTCQRQVEEARKLKEELQTQYDRLKELRGLPFRGIV